jgi:ABC-type sugar transport system permease subunit
MGMPASKGLNKYQRRAVLMQYAFLTPQLILFVGLTILPFFVALPVLFTDQANYTDPRINPVGFSNFTALFTDSSLQSEYLPALRKTVVFVLLNYVMVYLFGLTLALLVYEIGFRGWFFTVVYLPLMASGLAIGFIAVMLFAVSTGTANLLFLKLGLIQEAIDIKSASGTTVILPFLVGWRWAGFNLAIFLSGLLAIPRETIDAAIVDGAGYWHRLTQVYFPQMIPSFIMASTFCLIGSFGVFDELVAMGALYANEEAKFITVFFFNTAFRNDRLALGMTMSLQTFLPLVILGVLMQRLQRRLQYY